MSNIQIIVGTVMGTALEVAETISESLEGNGHSVQIHTQFKKDILTHDPEDIFLICTSNTGMGDLPQNIVPFYEHLTQDYPRLAGRQYGLVNLGDSSYPNFAQAGKTLDDAMQDLGAQRLGEPLVLDAIYVSDYDDEAETWALEWGQCL